MASLRGAEEIDLSGVIILEMCSSVTAATFTSLLSRITTEPWNIKTEIHKTSSMKPCDLTVWKLLGYVCNLLINKS